MATPRPKVFTAAVPFSVAGYQFEAGDVVDGRALALVIRFGDRFVTSSTTTKEIP